MRELLMRSYRAPSLHGSARSTRPMLPPTQPGSDTLTHVGLHGNNPLASTQGCSPKRGRVSEAGAAQLSSFHGGRGTHPQMLDTYRAVQVTTTCEGQLKFSGRICVRGGGRIFRENQNRMLWHRLVLLKIKFNPRVPCSVGSHGVFFLCTR